MSEQPPPDGADPDPSRMASGVRPGVPRWVKTLGIVVAALVLLALLVMVASGGQHGPGRHRSGSLAPIGATVSLVMVTP